MDTKRAKPSTPLLSQVPAIPNLVIAPVKQVRSPWVRTAVLSAIIAMVVLVLVGVFVFDAKKSSPKFPTRLDWTFMTFNIEYGGQWYDLHAAADIIRNSNADIVTIQEAYTQNGTNSVPRLASILGWNHLNVTDFNNDSAIISRWPIELVSQTQWFVSARLLPPFCADSCPKAALYVISVHYTDEPYQPFQAANISYDDGAPFIFDPVELSNAAYAARGKAVDETIAEASRLRMQEDAIGVFVGGDFNEPSHLDWTTRAAEQQLIPYACEFANSLNYSLHRFEDTYRQVHPDEIQDEGISWPGYKVDYPYREDRIDFIYHGEVGENMGVSGVKLNVVNASVVMGYSPSDHRAVYAQLYWQW
eukprot:c2453_g1_i1.p1 GENE.c2453_g1_i1~~c2453_g1_i1.p1  ORF type:complete len:372 (-),score=88.95 c2453_g1_i1:197-1279(-)